VQSGGLVLGAYADVGTPAEACRGVLVDLVSDVDGYPARRTTSWSVTDGERGRRYGTLLREAERRIHQKAGVDLVYWDIDSLNSTGLHISLNKLGGIATRFTPDVLGGTRDALAPGLATDRLRIEWWIDAPRVIRTLDDNRPLPHQEVGLHEMTVLTTTTLRSSGFRGLTDDARKPEGEHVLLEIPESLVQMEARDHVAAIQWRLRSRDALVQLFSDGYLGVGLIHGGGRSFLIFKRGTRRSELGAAASRQRR
jgi:predicted GNAT superfamily acetyltransferase